MSDGKTPQDDEQAEDDAKLASKKDAEGGSDDAPDEPATDTPPIEDVTAPAAASPDHKPADDAASASAATDDADTSGGSTRKRVLWLAIVIIGIVLAAAAFLFWPRAAETPTATETSAAPAQRTEDLIPAATLADVDALRDEIGRLNSNLGELATALDDAEATINRQNRDFERLKEGIDERVDLLDSLPGRVQNTEDALSTLQGISTGSRNAWLLAEAEYYMQIANAQVQLANNPELAATALELADQRVRELGDPAYTPVRRALANEIAALNAVTGSDIEGVTLTLGSLASMVPTLPLINEIDVPEGDSERADLDALSGWQRMKASVNAALSGLVRIRQSDERVKAMLSPEAEYFLRLNLQLQLQAARLSLLLSETAGYQQSLQDAAGWLRDYFDRNNAGVQNALEMIDDIAETQMVAERPDISGSLRLLRQQRTVGAIAE